MTTYTRLKNIEESIKEIKASNDLKNFIRVIERRGDEYYENGKLISKEEMETAPNYFIVLTDNDKDFRSQQEQSCQLKTD